ncbi:ribonuclease H2, subunit B [Rhexocercosporidium sp. MPI-PUGE-AT-0058]|nr:ribonuclease H2, subunit B [Rhexocercosporidium sp. MPI-PUGE-AT-0058]
MKTRGRPSTKSAKAAPDPKVPESTAAKVQLSIESTNPPHLFILPKDISKDARIVTLENPRYFSDDRYVICPERGFYEFTKVAAPRTSPRSWLLSAKEEIEDGKEAEEDEDKSSKAEGYVMKTASLLVATPIDPLFMVLSALSPLPTTKSSEPTKKLFLSGYDYFEKMSNVSPHFASFSRIESIRQLLESRMCAVCDTVEAGDETMYRLNEEKLLGELLKKAKKMIENGLPASMEEKLVRKALDPPMLSIKRDDSSLSEPAKEDDADTPDTQTTTSDIATSSFSEASTAATSFSGDSQVTITVDKPLELSPIDAPEGVAELLRLRTALFFIFSVYLAPYITESLKKLLPVSTSDVDFAPLDTHLTHLAKLRQDALASRSLGDFSRKRSLVAEDGETCAEKKRKEDEDEKRKKANQSRGVQALKKVNVSGMKKMSDFFKKK